MDRSTNTKYLKDTQRLLKHSKDMMFDKHVINNMTDFWFNSVIQKALIPLLPFVLLGYSATATDIGLYAIANRISGLVGLILYSINSVVVRSYGDSLESGKIDSLGSKIKMNTFVGAILTFPIFFTIFIFTEPLLHIFGDEFIKAQSILIILTIGQVVNMLSGPLGTVFIVAEGEKVLRNGAFFTLIILLGGYYLLPIEDPLLRICIARSIGIITVNFYNIYHFYKRFNIISLLGRL